MSNNEQRRHGGVIPATSVANAVKALVIEHGEVEAARRLDVGRSTVTRVAAGLPCRRSTIALAAARLGIDDGLLRPAAS
jgi:hypothetical protein